MGSGLILAKLLAVDIQVIPNSALVYNLDFFFLRLTVLAQDRWQVGAGRTLHNPSVVPVAFSPGPGGSPDSQ